MTINFLPVLYSFRRCPYAIRARLALRYAGLKVALREVVLADNGGGRVPSRPQALCESGMLIPAPDPSQVLPDRWLRAGCRADGVFVHGAVCEEVYGVAIAHEGEP